MTLKPPTNPTTSLVTETGLDARVDLLEDALSHLYINIKDSPYLAKGDAKYVQDAAILTATANLTSASAAFVTTDVGKTVYVKGAGVAAAVLKTTILAYVSATAVTLVGQASTTVTSADLLFGTDDTTAIRTALTAIRTAGRGTLFSPKGMYLLATSDTATGQTWAAFVNSDDVELLGEAGTTWATGQNASILWVGGSAKPGGSPTLWFTHAPWRTSTDGLVPASTRILYPINAGTRGQTKVTTTTAADAGNFIKSDIVLIRTGQVVTNGSGWNGEPDGEFNTVLSVNAGTGVVTLEKPLVKDYASENQVSAGAVSSVGGAGSAAPMGISKVTAATVKNFSHRKMRYFNPMETAIPITLRGVVYGFAEEDIETDSIGRPRDTIEYTRYRFRRLRSFARGTSQDQWVFCSATCCSDIEGTDILCESNTTAVLHINEGTARLKIRGIKLLCGEAATTGTNPISINGRAYGIEVDDWEVSGGGTNSAVNIGAGCTGGGRIGKGLVRRPSVTVARTVAVASVNWLIEPTDDLRGGDVQFTAAVRSPLVGIPSKTLAGWVSDDNQTTTLGEIPAQSLVLRCGLYLDEIFDSSTTDTISIGHDASTQSFGTNTDVSVGTGPKAITQGAGIGYRSTSLTAKAYYVNGGTEPTTGRALAYLEYVPAPTVVA